MRLFVAPILGLVVALSLFVFSNSLISDEHLRQLKGEEGFQLEFIRAVPAERVLIKERQLPAKQPPPKTPPPVDRVQSVPAARIASLPVQIDMPDIEVPVISGMGPYLGTYTEAAPGIPMYDGDLIPLVQVRPRYPRHAEYKGIEGWVNVEFTIAPDGTVGDPVVIASEPPAVFDNSAINAIMRWKFKPRIVNGQPVPSRGQQLISFGIIERS